MQRTLVDQAKRGDEEAFDALARLTGDRCMAIAVRILRDPDRFEPWLHRILTNECYAEARRRTRWTANIKVLPVEPYDSGEILTVNDRDQLERAFRRLTLEQRAVLVFHRYLGLSLPEVADRLGVPLGTVKSRVHHATVALRASIEADDRTPRMPQERLA